MLTHLTIRNFGLIERLDLPVRDSLTVITGGTGAGKSMLIGALGFVLGEKPLQASPEKTPAGMLVEAVFDISRNTAAQDYLRGLDIPLEDHELILRRGVDETQKSRTLANGMRLNHSALIQLASLLVDRTGQHDGQQLFNPALHARVLDEALALDAQSATTRRTFNLWHAAKTQLVELETAHVRSATEQTLLQAFYDELLTVNYTEGEDETLLAERARLLTATQTAQTLQQVQGALSAQENGGLSHLARALRPLRVLVGKGGAEMQTLLTRAENVLSEAEDVQSLLEEMVEKSAPDPVRLEQVEERLNQLREVARKHRCDVASLAKIMQDFSGKLGISGNFDTRLAHAREVEKSARQAFESACHALTNHRSKGVALLAKKMEQTLAQVLMVGAKVDIRLTPLPPEKWSAGGAEQVEFFVSPNRGQPLLPLAKAASGGEVSRLMLALKAVLYAKAPSQTVVFDEIDTGTGGAAADAVGDVLRDLAKNHQVLAITHAPQVAVKGAQHWVVAKKTVRGHTFTEITPVVGEQRADEIARMLAGKTITPAARKAAESLLAG